MKKLCAIFFLFCYLTNYSFSQINNSALLTKDRNAEDKLSAQYLKKTKQVKTYAWIFLGSGVVTSLLGIGAATANTYSYALSGGNSSGKSGSALAYTGVTMLVGSITLFVISHHLKKKAVFLSNSESKSSLKKKWNLKIEPMGIVLGF